MLRSLNLLKGAPVEAADGPAGTIDGFLYDDEKWVVRYLVLRTEEPLGGRRVLISPVAVGVPAAERGWTVSTTVEQLSQCPSYHPEEPLTRAGERGYLRFFAWPLYWGGGYSGYWGAGAYPGMLLAPSMAMDPALETGAGLADEDKESDEVERASHVHRTDAVRGHSVLTRDGTTVGEVDDFLMDDQTWALAYVAVHTGGWLSGRRILVPVECFDGGSWAEGKVEVDLPAETLKSGPEWEPLEAIPEEYEQRRTCPLRPAALPGSRAGGFTVTAEPERFQNRMEAGRLLGAALQSYRGADTVVLGVPRGGVVVAAEVAGSLEAPLDVLISRKLGAPEQPELAIGAVVSGGQRLLDEPSLRYLRVAPAYVEEETARQLAEIDRRAAAYRRGRPPQQVRGKTVILVDDGVATGYTIRAALAALRNLEAARLVVAVPVAPPSTCGDLRRLADEVVCLRTPEPFLAVGHWYEDFEQNSDEEVTALLQTSPQLPSPLQDRDRDRDS